MIHLDKVKGWFMRKYLLFMLIMAFLSAALGAQSDPDRLEKTVEDTVALLQETQKKQDEWADQKTDLMIRYRNAQANIIYLTDYAANKRAKEGALVERVAELERRLREAKRLEESLQDTLNVILDRFEDQVEGGAPFLIEERTARLEDVGSEIARPDITGAEKLRRLLEALQVEANYGSTVDVYQQRIALGTDSLFVDVLRVGRISLFWRTPDGKRVGEFDY
ncbi:MAG TPA: DUF3450 domain-containing protein, partial [Candidatus Eisenbacteria bacterium]|nr:DUF3450 domain-containing protein [Candidatus Eisenbacteria bacterium]